MLDLCDRFINKRYNMSNAKMNNAELRRLTQKALESFVNRKRETTAWEGRKVIVYGAGSFGRDVAKALLVQPNITLLGFLDQNGSGQAVLNNLPAHQLESVAAKRWLAENPVVIIGIHNHLACVRAIKAQLTKFGFSTVLTPMEAYPYLSRELGKRFWLGTPEDYAAAAGPIEKVSALWADEESERLFFETLLYRLGIEMEAVTPPTDVSFQYAVPTLPRWQEPLRFIDGGAYTGDTLQSLLQHGYHFAAIHAFEPDSGNFRRLCITAAAFPPDAQISLWPCGLWSSTRRMSFSESGGPGSDIRETGPAMVPVVALDDVLHGQPVNLIKMDIEGSEPEALRGARRLIEKYRPGLAICLYHDPNHIWSIPLWVAGLNLDYHFYYRAHLRNTLDTVLYAIPKAP